MCILKDVLHHWSAEDIYTFLDYLVDNKCFKIIFIVNCCNQVDDTNINRGDFRPLNSKFFLLLLLLELLYYSLYFLCNPF